MLSFRLLVIGTTFLFGLNVTELHTPGTFDTPAHKHPCDPCHGARSATAGACAPALGDPENTRCVEHLPRVRSMRVICRTAQERARIPRCWSVRHVKSRLDLT